MALDSTHPDYDENVDDWVKSRDTYRGERRIKSKDEIYLPATAGMRMDGMKTGEDGRADYDSYKERAVFPDYVYDGIGTLMGLMHQKPATFELPKSLEYLLEDVDGKGSPMDGLLREINEEQLITGRIGLMLDLPEGDRDQPIFTISKYFAEAITNWGEDFIILNESGYEHDEHYTWEFKKKFRLLKIIDNKYVFGVSENEVEIVESELIPPVVRLQTLDKIPFIFINARDLIQCPDNPPLLGLANDTLTIYRGEADYRQNLFMQGQDTLIIKGDILSRASEVDSGNTPTRTGAGSKIQLNETGDAKFIGASSNGLPEQRQALDADRSRAETKSGALISKRSNSKESGEALKTRIAAQTVTLNQIAMTGAAGLQAILRIAAEWLGEDPEKVTVTANVDFTNNKLSGRELFDIQNAKALGAPISKQSIHTLMIESELTGLEFQDELDLIAKEGPDT